MRAARIWPGLVVCLLITLLAVGPVVTTIPIFEYFRDWQTRWYFLFNIGLTNVVYYLPGVFLTNHYKGAVNGSLWTLPIEVRCYLLGFALGLLRCLTTGLRALLAAGLLILLILIWPECLSYLKAQGGGQRLPFIFLAGIVCYAYREKLPIDWRVSAVALVFLQLFSSFSSGRVFFYIFLMNTVLLLAAWPRLKRFQPAGDYSYGIYIYGFVVQQIVANYFPSLTSYYSLWITVPITYLIGMASWQFVERPALGYGRSFADVFEKYRKI